MEEVGRDLQLHQIKRNKMEDYIIEKSSSLDTSDEYVLVLYTLEEFEKFGRTEYQNTRTVISSGSYDEMHTMKIEMENSDNIPILK